MTPGGADERDRLLLEARRARRARRQRLVPAAPARRRTEKGKIVVSENVTLDGVIQDPAGDEGFRAGGWVSPIGNSPQLAKLALDDALAAGPSCSADEATSGSPRGGHLAAASWRTG